MKKVAIVLLLTVLFMTTFKIDIRHAHAITHSIHFSNAPPFNSLYNAISSGVLLPGDHLHIEAGHVETLPGWLGIGISNLWIIGAPPLKGAMPSIDVAGWSIYISAPNIFVWGIDFWDSKASSPRFIALTPAATNCMIQSCRVRGSLVPGSVGIYVNATNVNATSNLLACNNISECDVGIDIFGWTSGNNIIKLNNINSSALVTGRGVQVVRGGEGTVGPNQIFWNNIIGVMCPPGSGLGQELWDAGSPGGAPINIFDDFAQPPGYSWNRGNFESSWAQAPPYPVAGPGLHGWFDRKPNLETTPIVGDVNLSGQVNIIDCIRLGNNFGTKWCTTDWDPRVDVRGDGVINILDCIALGNNFGYCYPPS